MIIDGDGTLPSWKCKENEIKRVEQMIDRFKFDRLRQIKSFIYSVYAFVYAFVYALQVYMKQYEVSMLLINTFMSM